MVQKKFIKLGLAGVAVAAIAIGLGVGLGTKNSNANKSLNSSMGQDVTDVSTYGAYADVKAVECIDEISGSKGGKGSKGGRYLSSVPGNDEYEMVVAPGNRRALRQEMIRELSKSSKGSSGVTANVSGSKGKGSKSSGASINVSGGKGNKVRQQQSLRAGEPMFHFPQLV